MLQRILNKQGGFNWAVMNLMVKAVSMMFWCGDCGGDKGGDDFYVEVLMASVHMEVSKRGFIMTRREVTRAAKEASREAECHWEEAARCAQGMGFGYNFPGHAPATSSADNGIGRVLGSGQGGNDDGAVAALDWCSACNRGIARSLLLNSDKKDQVICQWYAKHGFPCGIRSITVFGLSTMEALGAACLDNQGRAGGCVNGFYFDELMMLTAFSNSDGR